jgi:hypothetical protein
MRDGTTGLARMRNEVVKRRMVESIIESIREDLRLSV